MIGPTIPPNYRQVGIDSSTDSSTDGRYRQVGTDSRHRQVGTDR